MELKERLGLEATTVQRLRQTEEHAHSKLHSDIANLQTTFAGEVSRVHSTLMQAQGSVKELSQQLQGERQQRAADAAAFEARLGRAQQLADEQIKCGSQ